MLSCGKTFVMLLALCCFGACRIPGPGRLIPMRMLIPMITLIRLSC